MLALEGCTVEYQAEVSNFTSYIVSDVINMMDGPAGHFVPEHILEKNNVITKIPESSKM